MKQNTKQIDKQISEEVLEARRKSIGEQIKARRQRLSLTQDKLSFLAGIRKATLVDLELGRNFEANTLITVTEFLGGSVEIAWGSEAANF